MSIILYEFYTKEVSSKAVINARSALSEKMKRTVLTQEVLSVLMNTSLPLPWSHVVSKVEEMVLRMQFSGYNKRFRYHVVDSAIKAYKVRQEAERDGERPLHRPKGWSTEEREKQRAMKKDHWYKKGGAEAVIFVPATLFSQLQKSYMEQIKNQEFKIKVIEKSGKTLKQILQRSDPFRPRKCARDNCFVCQSNGRGPCTRHGVTYDIKCQGCESVYVGETARNAYTRGNEHMECMKKDRERSALWKHCVEKHDAEQQDFKMSVIGVYDNDAMLRQLAESVRINKISGELLMNSKKEWIFFNLPRAVIEET